MYDERRDLEIEALGGLIVLLHQYPGNMVFWSQLGQIRK